MQLIARPEVGKALAQVEQLISQLRAQRRLSGLMGKAGRVLLGLAEGPEVVLPRAFEFGCGQTVCRVDLLIAAPGQVGAEAGLSDLLLVVRLQTVVVTLAL